MTYDWDGRRTRRLQAWKLASAMALALVVPFALTALSYLY